MSATSWLTTDEVAAEIQMTRDWVARQCAKGAIRATKFGRDWRITRTALDDFTTGKVTPARTGRRRARA